MSAVDVDQRESARRHGRAPALAMKAAMRSGLDEVGSVVTEPLDEKVLAAVGLTDRDPAVFESLRHNLIDKFPALAGVRFTHAWAGPLGVPRDWHAGVGLDRGTGFARGGGYVGDGVGTSNPAGRTLADLITGRASDLTTLPWVGHRSRRWEPEPLRYLGVNTGLRVMVSADRRETRTGKQSSTAKAFGRFLGG